MLFYNLSKNSILKKNSKVNNELTASNLASFSSFFPFLRLLLSDNAP